METTFLKTKPIYDIGDIRSEFHARRIVTLSDGSTQDGPHNGIDFACVANICSRRNNYKSWLFFNIW